jgi:uncharacterized protein
MSVATPAWVGCHSEGRRLVFKDGGLSKGDPVSSDLKAVREAKTILLTTYKRDGTPVETPVSIAFDGNRRNNPQVEVAASTLRGKRTGPPIHGCATLLTDDQARIAAKALARRHRILQAILVPLAHRLMHYQTMHYELRFEPG